MKKMFVSMALIGAVASTAFANTGFYSGLNLGQSQTDLYTTVSSGASLDEKGTSFGVFAGYNFNKYLAAEMNYNKFGTAKLDFNAGSQFTVDGYTFNPAVNGKTEVDVQSLGLSIIAKYPLHEYAVPYVKFGFQRYEHESKTVTPIGSAKTNVKDNDKYYGFGLESNLSKNYATRISYEKFSMNEETDIKNYSVSFVYKF